MTVTQEFIQAVQDRDTRMVRIMLKDSLVVDPTFNEFNEMERLAKANIQDLYDEHDGEGLKYDIASWNKNYMDEQMVQVVYNFSKERVDLLKSICKHIYRERLKNNQDMNINDSMKMSTKKKVGLGLSIGGAAVTAAGAIGSKPGIIGAGIAAVVVGGVLIFSEQ